MSTSNNAQIFGAATVGGAGFSLLGFPIQTSILIGVGVLVILFASYLLYKFRNRHLR